MALAADIDTRLLLVRPVDRQMGAIRDFAAFQVGHTPAAAFSGRVSG